MCWLFDAAWPVVKPFAITLLPLSLVLLAFWVVLRPLPGVGSATNYTLAVLGRRAFRLLYVTVATVMDALITVAVAFLHVVTARDPRILVDDAAAFLHRLNDRILRIYL